MEGFKTTLITWELRLNNPYTAEKVWNTLLTDEQRRHWADLKVEYFTHGKPVAVWAAANQKSLEWAVIDLAHLHGMPELEYRSLSKQLDLSLPPHGCPVWKKEVGELRLGGEVIRRIVSPSRATNIVMVLDAFQQQNWKQRIKFPPSLKGKSDTMGQTTKSLNTGLTRIRFERDGTSQGIKWSFVPHCSE